MNPQMIFEILLRILADRVLLFVTLFLNFALFAYAVYEPDPWRFGVALAFSITVFFPVLRTKSALPTPQQEREAA